MPEATIDFHIRRVFEDIIDYIVVKEWSISMLRLEVLSKIDEGYVPLSGICVDDMKRFYQAMIKYSNEDVEENVDE